MADIFFRTLGSLFEFSFKIMPILGHIPNLLIIVTGIGMLGWWLKQLSKFGKEDTPMEKKEGREII